MNKPLSAATTRKAFQRLKKRHRKEKWFKMAGLLAISISFLFLGILLFSIFSKGYSAFFRTEITLPITFSQDILDPEHTGNLEHADYNALIRQSLKQLFPEVIERRQLFQLYDLVSKDAAFIVRDYAIAHQDVLGKTISLRVPASSDVDVYVKHQKSTSANTTPSNLKDLQRDWVLMLDKQQALSQHFNTTLFTQADSREPESAGILGSFIGSLLTILVCLPIAFPLAVFTAIYLEEFAPKNRFTDLIEVNINNLAAIPSIVFGLLGLAIFLGVFGIPRSSALAGGLTLALMILPIIVITTRHALRAVPPSLRESALALGASPLQVVWHHTLPLAMPGIMTGTILGIARALGETAPLLIIGMVAFVADIPGAFSDPATVMPVQIYLWSDSTELGFIEKTSAAIIVLLALLMILNGLAIFIRKKYEHRW